MQSTTSFVCVFMESERVEGRSRRQEQTAGGRKRKIAATSSGNRYLLANALSMFKHYDLTAAFSCLNRTEETCCSSADYNDICLLHTQALHLKRRHKKGQRTPGFAALSLLDLACKPVLTVGLAA